MTAHSRAGKYVEYAPSPGPADAFDADLPVSTGLSHLLVNNLTHLHDMASQPVISFWPVDGAGLGMFLEDAAEWNFGWRWEFPWSFAIDGRLRQPVLRVYTGSDGGAGDLSIRAKLGIASNTQESSPISQTPIFGAEAPVILNVEGTVTASSSGSSTEVLSYDGSSPDWNGTSFNHSAIRRAVESGGIRSLSSDDTDPATRRGAVGFPWLALEIYAKYSTGSERNAGITGIHLREFVG